MSTSNYITLEEALAYTGANPVADPADLEDVITTVSRMIDRYTGRNFYQTTTTQARYFETEETDCLDLGPFNDIATTVGLVVDVDRDCDGTYESTIASTNYQLEPVNAAVMGEPYTEIELLNYVLFPTPIANGREYLIRVTATWGWPEVPPAVKQATRILVAELAKLADAPLGVAGFADLGIARVASSLPPRARQLLEPFRHPGYYGIA